MQSFDRKRVLPVMQSYYFNILTISNIDWIQMFYMNSNIISTT